MSILGKGGGRGDKYHLIATSHSKASTARSLRKMRSANVLWLSYPIGITVPSQWAAGDGNIYLSTWWEHQNSSDARQSCGVMDAVSSLNAMTSHTVLTTMNKCFSIHFKSFELSPDTLSLLILIILTNVSYGEKSPSSSYHHSKNLNPVTLVFKVRIMWCFKKISEVNWPTQRSLPTSASVV